MAGRKSSGDPKGGPDPQKITEDALREAALRYLERHGASVHQVRNVLLRRVFKYGDAQTAPTAKILIEQILERFLASRILDDGRFADSFAESLRRRGASAAKIRQKLNHRGIDEELTASALSRLSEHEELSDLNGAETYARKRRLREKFDLSDPKQRQKALASLARQGFSFDVAKRALGL